MNLAKVYTPNDFEPTIYALWEKSGVFTPKGQGEPYAVVMPPPNANGDLHIGHALGNAIQDILVRYQRMRGKDALFIPGADHAGFETWVVYERQLEASGKSRFDYTRDELYAQVWDFVDKRRGDMELQLRALGAGVDWSRIVFTLDDKVTETVYDTFKRLWDDDLIYRGERIVNYCTYHQTGFSDIEVVYSDERGKLWEIAYPLTDGSGEIVVATTRPETMLGDTAVAVNPKDARYKDLIGKKVKLPLTEREIEIIADDYVDIDYGTGAVKITPAHDPNDFEVGERHNLERINVISPDGHMINVPELFEGLTIAEARQRAIEALDNADALRGSVKIEHSVGHCYKCDTVIEPMLKDQWFIRMKPLAKPAIEAIRSNKVKFTPEGRGEVLANYLEELRDWNISRQIPWGIPIPAFQNVDDPTDWIFDNRVNQTEIVVNNTTYKRDEDTFDTWFSSGQWPYIVTDKLSDGELSRFYPTAVMETGYDILYQWVGRMIMLGIYRADEVPFRDVYLHGLVNDENNQKMSKSKGNVINPMEIVAKYGSDALRIGVVSNRSPGQSQAFSTSKVVAGRNFCNKLWNVARFIIDKVEQGEPIAAIEPKTLADHWVLMRLDDAARKLADQIDGFRFAEATETVYHTLWDDVADWYVESSKVDTNTGMLAYVLEVMLKLSHPFAPFVTEAIWQGIPWTDTVLASLLWPDVIEYSDISAASFGRIKRIVTEARYVITELPGTKRYPLLYMDDSLVEDNAVLIRNLVRAESIQKVDQPRGLRLASSGRDVWLDIDADVLYEHQSNLEKRLALARQSIARLESRLSNDNYVSKAPRDLVEQSRIDLDSEKQRAERLAAELQVVSQK